MPSAHSEIRLDVFYQNVRGLRTKQLEFYDSVASTDYNAVGLTETWLNDSFQDHQLFPTFYPVFRTVRNSFNMRGGYGVLNSC
jgi:hypothetical protein